MLSSLNLDSILLGQYFVMKKSLFCHSRYISMDLFDSFSDYDLEFLFHTLFILHIISISETVLGIVWKWIERIKSVNCNGFLSEYESWFIQAICLNKHKKLENQTKEDLYLKWSAKLMSIFSQVKHLHRITTLRQHKSLVQIAS